MILLSGLLCFKFKVNMELSFFNSFWEKFNQSNISEKANKKMEEKNKFFATFNLQLHVRREIFASVFTLFDISS